MSFSIAKIRENNRRAEERDALLARTAMGELSIKEAEKAAQRLGCGPLKKDADKGKFVLDAFSEWTLFMAIAWIRWRDKDKVLDFHLPYLAKCTTWQTIVGRVQPKPRYYSKLVTRESECTLTRLQAKRVGARESDLDFQTAKQALWGALHANRITCFAVRGDTRQIMEVPSIEWPFLEAGNSSVLFRRDTSNMVWYEHTLVDGHRLLHLWPENVVDANGVNELGSEPEPSETTEPYQPAEPVADLNKRQQLELASATLGKLIAKGERITSRDFVSMMKAQGVNQPAARLAFKTEKPSHWKQGRSSQT